MLDRMILGTVQLGLKYGINNSVGKPSVESALEILSKAYDLGIKTIDTSDLYGESQNVITLSPIKNKVEILSKFSLEHNSSIGFHLNNTLKTLGVEKLAGYSFHRIKDFLDYQDNGEIAEIRKTGKFRWMGVSVYTNAELERAINTSFIDMIQVSFNLMDHAKVKNGLLEKAKEMNKIVHVRSVYLQGLFFKNPEDLKGNLSPLSKNLRYLQELAEDYSLSMEEMAMGYVLNSPGIDGVLFGVETLEQLTRNIDVIKNLKFKKELVKHIEGLLLDNPELLDARNWRVA